MNDTLINKRLVPQRAIIIYANPRGYTSSYHLENRDIESVNGKYVFGAASPVSENVLKSIGAHFQAKATATIMHEPVIPIHMLHAINQPGKLSIAWYRPKMKRKLLFLESLKLKCEKEVEVPATLYLLLNGVLHIYALMSDERPTSSTKLFNVPFLNIYADGNVCLGTAPVGRHRAATFEAEADRYERGFYAAQQTHTNQPKTCNTPLIELWKRQIKTGEPFPAKEELIQQSKYKTFGDLLTKLVKITENNIQQFEDDEEDFDDEA